MANSCSNCIHYEVCEIISGIIDVNDDHVFCDHTELIKVIADICKFYLFDASK